MLILIQEKDILKLNYSDVYFKPKIILNKFSIILFIFSMKNPILLYDSSIISVMTISAVHSWVNDYNQTKGKEQ